jgi:polyribonucleotide nucleotidyltransferase
MKARPRKFPRPTSTPRSSSARNAAQPLIAAQKELAAKVGKKKREITLNIVPDEILQEAKKLAGDRFVPALLTPGKLAREAACKAIQDEVGAKLVEKFGAEKVTPLSSRTPFTTSRRKPSAV